MLRENQSGQIEKNHNPETEQKVKIIIHFMRHGKKEKEPKDNDIEIRLTPAGKLQALCQAIELGEKKAALARGSLRKRTQETGGIFALSSALLEELKTSPDELINLRNKLAAQKESLNSTEQKLLDRVAETISLENLEAKYADKFNSEGIRWIEEDSRLDFRANGTIGEEMKNAYKEGNLMNYMVNKSDQRAIETKDQSSTTYTKQAAAVADIILGYAETSGELQQAVAKNKESFEGIKQDNQDNQYSFERFFASHASVGESFILKVAEILEKQEQIPRGAKQDILNKMPSGFQETEGFEVQITQDEGKAKITLTLTLPDETAAQKTKQFEITTDTLKEIIRQAEELKARIAGER